MTMCKICNKLPTQFTHPSSKDDEYSVKCICETFFIYKKHVESTYILYKIVTKEDDVFDFTEVI